MQAVLSSEASGAGLAVEFLSEIKGVSRETIVENAHEGVVRVPATGETVTVRVLDPVLLLAGKIRNAVEIDQDLPERLRQDVKHAAMLAVCVPHFLQDTHERATDQVQRRSVRGRYVTMLASLKNTYSGRQFEAIHAGVIPWAKLVPKSFRQLAQEKEIREQLHTLGVIPPSRGIRI